MLESLIIHEDKKNVQLYKKSWHEIILRGIRKNSMCFVENEERWSS